MEEDDKMRDKERGGAMGTQNIDCTVFVHHTAMKKKIKSIDNTSRRKDAEKPRNRTSDYLGISPITK